MTEGAPSDLMIRGARLRDRQGLWDIGIRCGRIEELGQHLSSVAHQEIDAAGRLVAPTYVNGHVHLDKCNLGARMRPNRTYTTQECLELTREHKRHYTVDDIVERASAAIREGISNGTTVFRGFADVDTIGGLRPLEGVLAVREKWRGMVRVEVVCFPQEGIVRDPGTRELMDEGMRMGGDVVGGIPWLEDLDEDMRAHVDFCFELAKKYDKDIHMLVDNTLNPNSRSLEALAFKAIREDYQTRVCASHREALAVYDDVHADKIMNLVKAADLNISTNPHVSLSVQARLDHEPLRRGLTRVKQLWQMGINLFSSQDDVDDPWYPFGRNDQQEIVSYLCHAAHMTYPDEIEGALDFVTGNAARALRLPDYGIAPAARADLNVLAAPTVREVVRLQQPPPVGGCWRENCGAQ